MGLVNIGGRLLTFWARMRQIRSKLTTARSTKSTLYWVEVESNADRCSNTIGLVKSKHRVSLYHLPRTRGLEYIGALGTQC